MQLRFRGLKQKLQSLLKLRVDKRNMDSNLKRTRQVAPQNDQLKWVDELLMGTTEKGKATIRRFKCNEIVHISLDCRKREIHIA